jgi:hypothetical protein
MAATAPSSPGTRPQRINARPRPSGVPIKIASRLIAIVLPAPAANARKSPGPIGKISPIGENQTVAEGASGIFSKVVSNHFFCSAYIVPSLRVPSRNALSVAKSSLLPFTTAQAM